MKLKFIALWGMLSISSIGFATISETVVTMPDAQTLQARLRKYNLGNLMDNTDIVKKLASQEKSLLDIANEIELFLVDCNESVKKEMTEKILKLTMATTATNRPCLFEVLLKGEPEALKQLKDLGLYEPPDE